MFFCNCDLVLDLNILIIVDTYCLIGLILCYFDIVYISNGYFDTLILYILVMDSP